MPFARRFALLFFFLLGSIVVYPYAESSGAGYYAFRVLGSAILLLTIWALRFSRSLLVLIVVLALAVPAALQHLVLHPQTAGLLPMVNRVLSVGFDLLVIVIISRHVFSTKEPTSETIFAALCVYLLIGFLFAGVYTGISAQMPKAFLLDPTVNLHTVPDRFDFLYLSFGTLTELGAPGIAAVAPMARSVILLEAILGILYMAVLISRLINATSRRRSGEPAPQPPANPAAE